MDSNDLARRAALARELDLLVGTLSAGRPGRQAHELLGDLYEAAQLLIDGAGVDAGVVANEVKAAALRSGLLPPKEPSSA